MTEQEKIESILTSVDPEWIHRSYFDEVAKKLIEVFPQIKKKPVNLCKSFDGHGLHLAHSNFGNIYQNEELLK